MKVALLSESPVDVAAVGILVEAILAKPIELVTSPKFEMRGWPSIRGNLRSALIEFHYQTETEALAVVVDSDDSPAHQTTHELPNGADMKCRLCYLRDVLDHTQRNLKPRAGCAPIKTAIGIAVPAIEAWYLCGKDPNATEAAWFNSGLSKRMSDHRKALKRAVYGTDRITLSCEQRAREEAQRLAQDLSLLEKVFPVGFGALARSIREW